MPTDNRSNNQPRQINLAQKAGATVTGAKKTNKKRKMPPKKIMIIAILITIIVSMIVFLILAGRYVYNIVVPPKTVNNVSLTSHETTPEADQGKVAYYVLGLLGEENNSPTEMMSILCYDKQKKTINILQIPQDTYLGESGQWATKLVSEVWGNPKPLDWCTSCRKQLTSAEITDGKHTVCGTKVTQKTGSAPEDLLDVFNDQYGLPVDGYFLMPQKALVKLVNLLGGVDVNLEEAMTVGEIDYNTGVQTLDGDAALYYALNRKDGVSGDIDRLVRQRKVFLAIFQRLARQTKKQLEDDTLGPLMNGSTPICSYNTRAEMIDILLNVGVVKPASMTAYILPGETGKTGGVTYFAAHKAELLKLLNQSFNPYGTALTESDLGLTEIKKDGETDLHMQVLSDIEAKQSGAVVTTAATTGTTTADKAS